MGRLELVDPNPKGLDLINHEDLSIFVELVTTKKERSAIKRNSEANTTSFQKGGKKIPIKFLNGSDTDGDKRNELTTHYTEINTNFNKTNPDLESFGITSIDIDFNSSYTPVVKINFTDVRGKLFEMGEDSPYNVFFNLPYPIFELTVKGYYGKAVKYCLHLTKFTGKLNDKTGNFEIQCDFIGYTYAFLADMLMGYMRGIAETDIAKDKIKDAKIKFAQMDPPQAFFGMNEFTERVQSLNKELSRLKENDEDVKRLTKAESAIIKIDEIKNIINKNLRFINNEIDTSTNKNIEILYKNGFILFNKSDDEITKTRVSENIDTHNKQLTEKIKLFNEEQGSNYSISENSVLINNNTFSYSIFKKDFIQDSKSVPSSVPSSIRNRGLDYYNEFSDKLAILNNISDDKEMGYIDLTKALEEISDTREKLFKYSISLKETISGDLIEKIEEKFKVTVGDIEVKFTPTIKNMLRILTEHVHILMKSIKEVSGKIKDDIDGNSRGSQFSKMSIDNLEVKSDTDFNEILPFPDYKEKNSGNNAFEDKWVGNIAPDMPEVDFIEQLLEGLIQARKNDDALLDVIESNAPEWYPINPFDTKIATGYVNPWELFRTSNDPDEIIRHMLIRATIVLGHSYKAGDTDNTGFHSNEIIAMAKLEANNCFNNIETESIRRNIAYQYGNTPDAMSKRILELAGLSINPSAVLASDFLNESSVGNINWKNSATNFNNNNIFGVFKYTETTIDLVELTRTLVGYKYIPTGNINTTQENLFYLPLSTQSGGLKYWSGDKLISKDGSDLLFDGSDISNYVTNEDRVALREDGNIFFGGYIGANSILDPKPDDGSTFIRIIDTSVYTGTKQGLYPDYTGEIVEGLNTNPVFDMSDLDGIEENFSSKSGVFSGKWKIHEFINVISPEGNELPAWLMFYDNTIEIISPISSKRNLINGFDRAISDYDIITTNDIAPYGDIIGKNKTNIKLCNQTKTKKKLRNLRADYGYTREILGESVPTTDNAIPYLGFRVTNVGILGTRGDENFIPLFGSDLYYNQTSTQSKAFLFLHTIPFNGLTNTDKFPIGLFEGDIKHFFNQRAGFVNVPNSWILFIGALLWRYKSDEDPIRLNSDTGYSLLLNGQQDIDKDEYIIPRNLAQVNRPFTFTDEPSYFKIDDILINLPDSVKNIFIDEFTKWSDGDSFTKIRDEYEIFKPDTAENDRINLWLDFNKKLTSNPTTLLNSLDDSNNVLNPNFAKNYIVGCADDEVWKDFSNIDKDDYTLIDNLKTTASSDSRANSAKTIINNIVIDKDNKTGSPFNFHLEMRDNNNTLFDFLLETKVIINSTWRIWVDNIDDDNKVTPAFPFRFNPSKINNYVRAFSEEYRRLVENDRNILSEEDEAIKRRLFNSIDADDIKLNLYKNIKSIYDKWIPDTKCDFEFCGTSDGGSCPNLIDTFRFIDRGYNDIGDTFLINPLNMITSIVDDYNISMYDFLARTLVDNNFDFIPLPTFIDYDSNEEVAAAFKPEPFNVMTTASGPQFICMYIGERSKNLNTGGENDHINDGINLDSDADLPEDFKSGTTVIPAFRVAYGDANQSMFKNFKLDQQEFTETDESLQIIDEISKRGGPNNPSTVGQNLFNIYRTRSYSAEIESLGNAQIQPFMYFQLDNVPLFNGGYTLIHVKHSIKPNHMSTQFKGVRVRKTRTKMVERSTIFMNLVGSLSEVDFSGVELGEITDNDKKNNSEKSGKDNVVVYNGNVPENKNAPDFAGCITYKIQDNVGLKVQRGRKVVDVYDKNVSGTIVNHAIRDIGKFMEEIGNIWYNKKNKTIYYNDFSNLGGGESGHQTHKRGTSADIRQVRKDNKDEGLYVYKTYKKDGKKFVPTTTELDPDYDREGTKELFELILDNALKKTSVWSKAPIRAIYFNDKELQTYFKTKYKNRDKYDSRGIVKEANGHHHHFHIEFDVPDYIDNNKNDGYIICKQDLNVEIAGMIEKISKNEKSSVDKLASLGKI